MQYSILTNFIGYFENPNSNFSQEKEFPNMFGGSERYKIIVASYELSQFSSLVNQYFYLTDSFLDKVANDYYATHTDDPMAHINELNIEQVFWLLDRICYVPFDVDALPNDRDIIEQSKNGTILALLKRMKELDNGSPKFILTYAVTYHEEQIGEHGLLSIESHIDGKGIVYKEGYPWGTLSPQPFEYFKQLISMINLDKWKDRYDYGEGEEVVWSIRYSLCGEPQRTIIGMGATPDDFFKLSFALSLIDETTKENTCCEQSLIYVHKYIPWR